MCVYSMIADHYTDRWQRYIPPAVEPTYGYPVIWPTLQPDEIEDVRKLLAKAKEYDERTGQPDCELEEKKEILRRLAVQLGVEIELP